MRKSTGCQIKDERMPVNDKTFLVTGGARRLGRHFALTIANAGGNVVIHHANSDKDARTLEAEIKEMGRCAWVIRADFSLPDQAARLVDQAWCCAPLDGIINNAAIFEPVQLVNTSLQNWQQHLNINLTAPFLLCQAFAKRLPANGCGRIVNILDWRAMRPGRDHFPYTISKAGLAAMTRSLALVLAPRIIVNGLALGAVLPPSDGSENDGLIRHVPAGRWAELEEVGEALLFVLGGPDYITGEIISVDGGRHLI